MRFFIDCTGLMDGQKGARIQTASVGWSLLHDPYDDPYDVPGGDSGPLGEEERRARLIDLD